MPFDAEPSAEVLARDRVLRLRDFLAALPDERFNMSDFISTPSATQYAVRYKHPIGKVLSECGTAACIAGWTQFLFDPTKRQDEGLARMALGLTEEQAEDLFYPDGCSFGLVNRADAVAVLDNYLATGDIDWTVAG